MFPLLFVVPGSQEQRREAPCFCCVTFDTMEREHPYLKEGGRNRKYHIWGGQREGQLGEITGIGERGISEMS